MCHELLLFVWEKPHSLSSVLKILGKRRYHHLLKWKLGHIGYFWTVEKSYVTSPWSRQKSLLSGSSFVLKVPPRKMLNQLRDLVPGTTKVLSTSFLPDCPFKMSGAAQMHFGSCYAPKYANLFLKEDGFLKEAGSTFGLQS